jgi:hypothetical protein
LNEDLDECLLALSPKGGRYDTSSDSIKSFLDPQNLTKKNLDKSRAVHLAWMVVSDHNDGVLGGYFTNGDKYLGSLANPKYNNSIYGTTLPTDRRIFARMKPILDSVNKAREIVGLAPMSLDSDIPEYTQTENTQATRALADVIVQQGARDQSTSNMLSQRVLSIQPKSGIPFTPISPSFIARYGYGNGFTENNQLTHDQVNEVLSGLDTIQTMIDSTDPTTGLYNYTRQEREALQEYHAALTTNFVRTVLPQYCDMLLHDPQRITTTSLGSGLVRLGQGLSGHSTMTPVAAIAYVQNYLQTDPTLQRAANDLMSLGFNNTVGDMYLSDGTSRNRENYRGQDPPPQGVRTPEQRAVFIANTARRIFAYGMTHP